MANMHLSRFPIWPAHYWQGIQRTAGCEMELQVFDGGVSTLLGDGDVLRAKGSYDPSPGLQPRGFTDAVAKEPRAVVEEQVVTITTAVTQG